MAHAVDNLARIHVNGSLVEQDQVRAPHRLILARTAEARLATAGPGDFRIRLARHIGVGMRVLDVFAREAVEDAALGDLPLQDVLTHARLPLVATSHSSRRPRADGPGARGEAWHAHREGRRVAAPTTGAGVARARVAHGYRDWAFLRLRARSGGSAVAAATYYRTSSLSVASVDQLAGERRRHYIRYRFLRMPTAVLGIAEELVPPRVSV
jgi:hypothetical protein